VSTRAGSLSGVQDQKRTNDGFPQPHTNAVPAFGRNEFCASVFKGVTGLDHDHRAASESILFDLCRSIACRAVEIFCDPAGPVASRLEIRCPRNRGIRFLC